MRAITDCVDNGCLHLILMPTERCNFRCTYCYERFELKRMEPWVVEGVKGLLSARASELHALTLSWFGGEPLLARDIVDDILTHARALQRCYPRMQLRSDITTNAYLLERSVFEGLLELGVRQYQITFDGPAKWHDQKRVLANGRGTFARIWTNLLATRQVSQEFRVAVRLHLDRDNYRSLPEFIRGYDDSFGTDPRYRLFLRRLARFGGPNDETLPVLEGPEAKRIERELARCTDDGLGHTHGSPSICYAAKANSLLVRADGRLNKCTVALDHPANQVGRILADGHVALDADRMHDWMRGLWNVNLAELGCPLHGLVDSLAPTVATAPRRSSATRRPVD